MEGKKLSKRIAIRIIWHFTSGIGWASHRIPDSWYGKIISSLGLRELKELNSVKEGAVLLTGSKAEVPVVHAMLLKLMSIGFLDRDRPRWIICMDSHSPSLAYEWSYPVKILMLGKRPPRFEFLIYKLIVRDWARKERISYFKWEKRLATKRDDFWKEAQRIAEAANAYTISSQPDQANGV